MTTPRGIRNNNPGNLRPGSPWQGAIGNDGGPGGGYLVFDTPANGLRAMAKLLRNYQDKGRNSVRQIITAWAPSSDSNDTAAYIKATAAALGVNPDAPLNVKGNDALLARLVAAIIKHENGQQPYTGAQIAAAIEAAK